jgi:hypothetical protein
MEPGNRREFLRVEVRLPAACRTLSQEERKKIEAGLASSLFRGNGNPSLMDEMIQQAAPDPQQQPLYHCLQLLNNKLDFLIDQFAFTGEQKKSTLTKVIEISGSGLKFTSFEPFRAGTLLKMDLIIPVTLQFRIELIAEVVRTEEIQETPNQDKYVIGARFVIIDEDSRDSIIKTVFKTHRRIIRMEKNR